MSDRMVVMQGGKIEEMGDADQIYSEAKTTYTQNSFLPFRKEN